MLAGGSSAATALGLLVLALVAAGATRSGGGDRAPGRNARLGGGRRRLGRGGPGPPPRKRPVSAATKDLLLVARDRPQLLALIAMPIIFVGVQIFGAAGWSWSTGSLPRVLCVAYSLALYMATIGPLTHMQAERRAFWILRTVPVPLARLLAAKARAWAVIVGGTAGRDLRGALAGGAGAVAARPPGRGLLVTGCAAGACFLAVAMASGGADLSEEQRPAVGPGTIYAFLLVGGLFNLVLVAAPSTRLAGLALYLFATWAYWRSGIARAEICMDAEALRARRLRVADGATMLIVYALGYHAAASIPVQAGDEGEAMRVATAVMHIGLTLGLVAVAARYLARVAERVGSDAAGDRAARRRGAGAAGGPGPASPVRGRGHRDPAPEPGGVRLRPARARCGGAHPPRRHPACRRAGAGDCARAVGSPPSSRPAWGWPRRWWRVQVGGFGVDVGALGLIVATQATAALAFALTGSAAASWAMRLGIFLVGVGAFP